MEEGRSGVPNSVIFGFSLGDRFRYVRESHQLTRKAIAEMLRLSPSTWASYENDRTVPSQATIANICSIFHVREEWLWENDGAAYEDDYRPGDPLGKPVDYEQIIRDRAEDVQMRFWFGDKSPEEMTQIRESVEKWIRQQTEQSRKKSE